MMYKGHAKQNTKKELKETLNWTSSTEISSTGRTDAYSIGASDGCQKIRRPVRLWRSSEDRSEAPDEPTVSREASVHSTYYIPETMSSAQQPSLQHRLNRWCVGAKRRSNDVSKSNGYMEIKRHKLNRH